MLSESKRKKTSMSLVWTPAFSACNKGTTGFSTSVPTFREQSHSKNHIGLVITQVPTLGSDSSPPVSLVFSQYFL